MAVLIPIQNTPIQLQDTVTSVNMSSGTLSFFNAGTTTTQTVFSDSTGTSAGSVVTLDSGGFPAAGGNVLLLFRDQSKALKIVCKNLAGAVIYTADNIPAVASFDSTSSEKLDDVEANADVTDATNVGAVVNGLQEYSVPLTNFYLPFSFPCDVLETVEGTTGMPNYRGYPFGAGLNEHIQFLWEPPKRWDRGTVTVMINYSTAATDADGVAWVVRAVALSDGDNFAQAFGTGITATDSFQSGAGKRLSITTGDITIDGEPADADLIAFDIYREPSHSSDTASEHVTLLGAKIFWTSDALNDA